MIDKTLSSHNSFENMYPPITTWVNDQGWMEIGQDDYSRSMARWILAGWSGRGKQNMQHWMTYFKIWNRGWQNGLIRMAEADSDRPGPGAGVLRAGGTGWERVKAAAWNQQK
jgi:hypothetical protein